MTRNPPSSRRQKLPPLPRRNSAHITNLNLPACTTSEAQRQPEDAEVGSSQFLSRLLVLEVSLVKAPAEIVLDPRSCGSGKDGHPSGTSHEDQQTKPLTHNEIVNWVFVPYPEKRTELLESNP